MLAAAVHDVPDLWITRLCLVTDRDLIAEAILDRGQAPLRPGTRWRPRIGRRCIVLESLPRSIRELHQSLRSAVDDGHPHVRGVSRVQVHAVAGAAAVQRVIEAVLSSVAADVEPGTAVVSMA